MKRSFFLRIFLGYAGVVVLLALAVAVIAPPAMRRQQIVEQEAELSRLAPVFEDAVMPYLMGRNSGSLEAYLKDISRRTGIRLTVVEPDGRVLGDSEREPGTMENHLYRPEVNSALQGAVRSAIRPSSTLNRDMLYMGFPLKADGKIIGVLRLSRFMEDLDKLFGRLRSGLLKTIGIVTLLALLASSLLARSIAQPIRDFGRAAAKVAGGDFGVKLSLRQRGEFQTLARSFNAMTDELDTLFRETRFKTEELNSILASLRDGLCVVGEDDRITLCNDAFRNISGGEAAEGKYYWEAVRSSKLGDIIRRVKASASGISDELALADRYYAVSAVHLPSRNGLVVTFHDMTEFKNIERIKKDFVTNVSHELKTPLAAIKGFAETMEPLAGEEVRRYIEIIMRNTDRLIAIVEDLLVLSELEEKGTRIAREDVDVAALASDLFRLFEKRARDKGIDLVLEADASLPRLNADPYELERLLANLLDNAVKYTEKGRVVLTLSADGEAFKLEVADTGIGIAADHLPHVFERFYVTDRSRSRKLGGTGLGLSIAKHIAAAHGGAISVKSRLGEGTTFTVVLPRG